MEWGYVGLCAALVLIALFVVPTYPAHWISTASSSLLSVASLAAIWAMVAVATAMFLNLTGLPTLAQAGLWGVGAYASGLTMIHLDIGFWPSLLFAAAAPAIVALPIALVSLRTTGVAFLVVTIAFTEFIVLLIINMEVTNGPRGVSAPAPPEALGPFRFESLQSQYYLFLFFLLGATLVYAWVSRSRFGARVRAIRDDERLASSLGMDALWLRVLLFEVSAVIAGLAGALLLVQQQTVTPELFGALQFIPIYLAIVLGGTLILGGPILGAWIVQFLPVWLGAADPNIAQLIYGAILVVAMLLIPSGILGTLKGWMVRRDRDAGPQAEPADDASGAPLEPVRAPKPPEERPRGDVVLETQGIKRWFGANRALDGVDLKVCAGEVRGLIGPNGSGKTTLLNCVAGFLPLTAGATIYRGQRIDGRRPDAIARMGLVRTFQEPRDFESFTVGESCELVATGASGRSTMNEDLPADAHEILDSCRLHHVADAPVTELPHGQRRLLGVALALSTRPFALLLDEPAAGLGQGDTDLLRDVILRAADAGVAVVVIDHDMAFLLPICHSITVLDGGTRLAEGDPEVVSREESVIAAYLGETFAREQAQRTAQEA